jgi:peptidoglycan/LPS O-acetylase OafA/YrhL
LAAGCLPTFGALFLLASGLGNERTPLMKILSSRPVVAIGVLSYGWYLWHWPLTAFARTLPFAHGSHWKDIAASSVALILSVPTYLFLEQPMKSLRRSDITRRFGGSIIIAGLAGSAVVAIVALFLARSPLFVGNALRPRFPTPD